MKYKIYLYEPFINNEERKNVIKCIDSNWISSKGKFIDLFERKFKNYIKTKMQFLFVMEQRLFIWLY